VLDADHLAGLVVVGREVVLAERPQQHRVDRQPVGGQPIRVEVERRVDVGACVLGQGDAVGRRTRLRVAEERRDVGPLVHEPHRHVAADGRRGVVDLQVAERGQQAGDRAR
jgi:hypothetical protein